MTESKHTPGPWIVCDKEYSWPIIVSDDDRIAIAKTDTSLFIGNRKTAIPDEAHANARLIAAAPKMLSALEELLANASNMANHLNAWNELHGHDPDDRYLIREFDSIEAKARAAIAEAKGEEE